MSGRTTSGAAKAYDGALRFDYKFGDEKAMSSVKVLITGIVSIVIQFGLAIVGWGGWGAFFAHPALRVLAWVTVGLAALAVPSGGSICTGEKEDRSNRWVLAAFGVIALVMAYFSAYTDRAGFWTLDGDAMRWMALPCARWEACCGLCWTAGTRRLASSRATVCIAHRRSECASGNLIRGC